MAVSSRSSLARGVRKPHSSTCGDSASSKRSQATALPGTDGAESPFFSPDGQQIAFFAGGKLKRISVTGGAPVTVCDAPNGDAPGAGAAHGLRTARSCLCLRLGRASSLWRVSSAGGKAEPLASLAKGEFSQTWPQVLPGGRAVLYTASDRPGAVNDANLVVQPLPSGAPKVVHRGGYHGRYLPSGHLVYLHDGVLFAVPFDLDRLQSTGQATSVLDGVTSSTHTGSAQFAVSTDGTLGVSCQGRASAGCGRSTGWIAPGTPPRCGSALRIGSTSVSLPMDAGSRWNFFPDQRLDVWVYDWDRDTATPLNRHPASEFKAVWTPDGSRIAFNSNRDKSPHNLYWQRADGTGNAQRLTKSPHSQWPVSWHPSGKFLAFEEHKLGTDFDKDWDVMILPMEGDEGSGWKPGTPTAFLDGPSEEMQPNFSPDGTMARVSVERNGTL